MATEPTQQEGIMSVSRESLKAEMNITDEERQRWRALQDAHPPKYHDCPACGARHLEIP